VADRSPTAFALLSRIQSYSRGANLASSSRI
jgi:hypothetical protein